MVDEKVMPNAHDSPRKALLSNDIPIGLLELSVLNTWAGRTEYVRKG
jgi:hypothetical protein